MLDTTQIFLRSLDDAMGTGPIALLGSSWIPPGQ
jgi:hypothetical protein